MDRKKAAEIHIPILTKFTPFNVTDNNIQNNIKTTNSLPLKSEYNLHYNPNKSEINRIEKFYLVTCRRSTFKS